MPGWLGGAHAWIKALHIVSVIAWMAGLLYLPRLYVYHRRAGADAAISNTFKVMERRLLRAIMTPALLLTFATGGLLLAAGPTDYLSLGWMRAKLVLVLLLTIFHGALVAWRRELADDRDRRSAGFYRAVNEVPAILMIGIVVFVIVRPF